MNKRYFIFYCDVTFSFTVIFQNYYSEFLSDVKKQKRIQRLNANIPEKISFIKYA